MQNKFYLPIFLFSGILSLTAWAGIGLVLIYLPPMIGPRWLFFFFLFLAVSSISFPILILINQRIERNGVTSLLPSVRESIELAFFVGLVVWLKFGRVLEFFTAGLILFGIVAIELMIRMIERSRFSPNLPEQENNEE